MSFAFEVAGGGRSLRVTDAAGAAVCSLDFGLPGEPVPGWVPDEEDACHTAGDGWEARIRHLRDDGALTAFVSLDNREPVERPLPPVGMAVTVADGWCGWSWTADVDGFVVVAPRWRAGEVLRIRLRKGFLRAAQQRPVFTSEPRREGGAGLPVGCAAFHLANPTGSLKAHGRHQLVLTLGPVPTFDEAAQHLPDWLPPLVASAGDEVRFVTPDLALVPGPGATLILDDTVAVLTGEAGHRELAVHGVRGVQRLRVTFPPSLPAFLADLGAALKSRRPSAVTTATGAVIAAGYERGAVLDDELVLDWLEREDWLARADPLGVAIAGVVATRTRDVTLLEGAWDALEGLPWQAGSGLVTMRLWLAALTVTGGAPDLGALLQRRATDELGALELALLRHAEPEVWGGRVSGLIQSLGGVLPGQPVGMPASDAALRVSLLRLVPEAWPQRPEASATAVKASAQLLADFADGLHTSWDGLAWLLLGDIGA